jgi:hypothetical protein
MKPVPRCCATNRIGRGSSAARENVRAERLTRGKLMPVKVPKLSPVGHCTKFIPIE